jgi:phosphohistidine phosphatase SixA
MKKLLFLLLLAIGLQQSTYAQKTLKVWIVRHAEKEVSDVQDNDTELSNAGAQRAEALKKELKGQRIDSIFSTDYKRTKFTGFPLADITGINMKIYNPADAEALVKSLKQNAAGKKVLIIGHSNTILELIEAFGAKRPVPSIGENEYDNIFLVTVKGDKVDVKADKYGEKSVAEEP